MCCCKDLVDGTPQLAISQGVNVSLYQQQEDGSFALLEVTSANNFYNGSPVGGPIQWRADDEAIVYASPVKPTSPLAGDFTLLQRDPLKERYFQGVQLPDSGGNGGRFSGGGAYMIADGEVGGIDNSRPGPAKPQTVNSPAGWANTSQLLTQVAPPFASVSGATANPLIATNFGAWGTPGLPPGATFAGVFLTIAVNVSPTSDRDIVDNGVYLTLDGTNPVGTDQSKPPIVGLPGTGVWCPDGTGSEETRNYGGWGYTPTIDEANSDTFGIIFNAKSLSGAGEGFILSFTLTAGWSFTQAGIVYVLVKRSGFGAGPLSKFAVNNNVIALSDTSRLRVGATVQTMNPNRTCKDNAYLSWSGTQSLSPPPSHPRPTTKTSPGILCEWTDPTFAAYRLASDGGITGWSGDDFTLISRLSPFAVGESSYSGPAASLFDGINFTPATMDTLTLPGTDPSGWNGGGGVFAADGIHAVVLMSPLSISVPDGVFLAERSGNNLGNWSRLTFTGVDIGDVNHTIATAQSSVFDISADGGLLAFRATNGGALPERIHVYSGGSVAAVLVPASITTPERIKQIKFSDDVGTGSIALAVCTDSGSGTGRTSVFTSTDGGSTWTEAWQHPFVGQGVAFAHGYRVP